MIQTLEETDKELHDLIIDFIDRSRKGVHSLKYLSGKVYEKRGLNHFIRTDLMVKMKPNKPCICGSGKKYKKCCMN